MNSETNEEAIRCYSNSARLAMSVFDFQVSFFQKSTSDEQIAKANKEEYHEKLLAEIIMSPSHAKAVSQVLFAAVKKYEEDFGEIKLKPSKK